jgi:hypothetical protein
VKIFGVIEVLVMPPFCRFSILPHRHQIRQTNQNGKQIRPKATKSKQIRHQIRPNPPILQKRTIE